MKTLILAILLCGYAFGQCGRMVINPTTGKLDCIGSSGAPATENLGSVSGTVSLSCATPKLFTLTVTGTTTIELTAATADCAFAITQDGTGSRSVTFDAGTFVGAGTVASDAGSVSRQLFNGVAGTAYAAAAMYYEGATPGLSFPGVFVSPPAASGTIVTLAGTETLTNKTHTNPSLGTGPSSVSRTATAGSGGVTAKYLAAKDTSDPTKRILPSSGGCGAGIAATTATSGNTFQLYVMPGSVITGVADNAITAGHILIGGTSTPGTVRDSGQTSRKLIDSGTCIVGVALAGASLGADVLLEYDGPGTYGQLRTLQAGFMMGSDTGATLTDALAQTGIWTNKLGMGVHITNVYCFSDAGTPAINLKKAGASSDLLTSNLSCSSSGTSSTTFNSGEDAYADAAKMNLTLVTASTAKRVTVYWRYTID